MILSRIVRPFIRRILICLLLTALHFTVQAQKISGMVYNDKGDILPFSSITVKGSSQGASANADGYFSFSLEKGKYTLVCRHIGYAAAEQPVDLQDATEVTFILKEQRLVMKEVV